MRQYITIITLLIASIIRAQTRDIRASLELRGAIDEISVSPDEKIWLVSATGQTYYTNNIDSNWHYGKSLAIDSSEFSVDNPFLNRISFFNKDTAIMTGWISLNKDSDKYNGLYFTGDGGQNWQSIDFGGDAWIYHVYVDKTGHAWMGGSSGNIYYSYDFGKHWKTLNSPYDAITRMNSIFMLTSNVGISGALGNYIYTTNDNWRTYKRIPTPFDQKKYEGEGDNRIDKIFLWNNYIVVNQQNHFYYSDASNVNWKLFPVKLVNFELDTESKILYAMTDSLGIISFSTPSEYQAVTNSKIGSNPQDIKIVNHSVFIYAYGYGVYRINSMGVSHSNFYTTDKKISLPENTKQSKNIMWGITGNQIYLSEDKGQNWYRENTLDFYVADFRVLNDSTTILWDGRNNYMYSLREHAPKLYFPQNPLQSFLSSKLKIISLTSGSQGCFHYFSNTLQYERKNDSIFTSTGFSKNDYEGKKLSKYKNDVNSIYISKILTDIDSNPSKIPTLKEFHITEADKQNYLNLVKKEIKNREPEEISGMKSINKTFYNSVPKILDTINNSIILKVLDQPEYTISTTSNWFTIQLINNNSDTINIERRYYVNTKAWNMPWKFEYKGQNFNCYNIEFSRFINSCIPDEFIDKDVFDNKILILEIADYLYNDNK